MKIIESIHNKFIHEVAKLHLTKERKKQERFVVEGLRAVTSFVENGYKSLDCYITEYMLKEIQADSSNPLNQIELTLVTFDVMAKVSNAVHPSGVLAVFAQSKNPDSSLLSSGLVLANVTDPGNMGTLIRSAAAFGYKTVVVVEGCDPFSPKAIQASAGALPLINLFEWSWKELLENKKHLPLCALTLDQNALSVTQANADAALFVVGNEANGLCEEWAADCDLFITIPMTGKTESLNAAVAGSIVLAFARFNKN